MPASRNPADEGQLRVTVLSGGTPVADTVQLVSATVARSVVRVGSARLEILDGEVSTMAFAVSDSEAFAPGAVIRIDAGHGDDEQTIFEGTVTGQAIRIVGGDEGRLVVTATDGAAPQPATGEVLSITYGVDLMTFDAELEGGGLRGRVGFQGSARVDLGGTIELWGVGHRFSGPVTVTGLTHTLRDGNWLTEVEFDAPSRELVTPATPSRG